MKGGTAYVVIVMPASTMWILLVIFLLTSVNGGSNNSQVTLTISEHFENGVEAYLDERWDDCINNFETARTEYKSVREENARCKMKCQKEVDDDPVMFQENVENLHFYERIVKKTLCMLKCRNVQLFKDKQLAVSKEMEKNFEQLKLYEYLQLCYYQTKLSQKAASAAFTFLVGNPKHETVLSNLHFYTSLPEVKSDEIVNFEAHPYVSSYVRGSKAYENKDYNLVINYIEKSLKEYLRAEEVCRAHCEGPFDQGWFPDYTSSIANHFTYCLKCKRKCPNRLNDMNGDVRNDLLPSHYHYLQFAYYKIGELQKACEATTSYLLFYPEDKTMLDNLEYYKNMETAKPEFFHPRQEALNYMKREEYENKLLSFIEKEFILHEYEQDQHIDDNNVNELLKSKQSRGLERKKKLEELEDDGKISRKIDFTKKQGDSNNINKSVKLNPSLEMDRDINQQVLSSNKIRRADSTEPFDLRGKTLKKYNDKNTSATKRWDILKGQSQCPAPFSNDAESRGRKLRELRRRALKEIIEKSSNQEHTDLVKGEEMVNETHRFLAEGFAHHGECQSMLQLARVAAVRGDGYGGQPSPHTEYETFDGMSIGRAALMVYFGLMEPELLDIFVTISERGRTFVERYFRLKSRLYFNYSHLVCRTAINMGERSSEVGGVKHMSHPIHGDNCNLLNNGDCTKVKPAFTWRDYSAVIYLNDDFEGGEFFFASNSTQHVNETLVKAKCGRMVGFTSGGENLHGVRGIKQGQRCAIGLWFTLDPKYNEAERILAQQVLDQVKKNGSVSEQLLKDLKILTSYK